MTQEEREQVIKDVLDTTRRFVGKREQEGNRGMVPDFCNWFVIDDFRDYPIGGKGAPWCATFLGTCGRLAMGLQWPIPTEAAMSSVQQIAMWGAEQGIVASSPEIGDILCVARGENKWSHIAIVQHVRDDGSVLTIEGNTNDSGSSEGIGVFALGRQVKEHDRLLRWANLI